jgi:nucleotide-binding universal stress UspA family protein
MIVVGIDGSTGSHEALKWAIQEARLRDAPLRVVQAWRYPSIVGGYGYVAPEEMDTELLTSAANDILENALNAVADGATDLDVERVVRQGPAAQVLIEESERAELLVVGSRGRGGFTGLLLGSVSQQCANHARCPIVIVHPENASA